MTSRLVANINPTVVTVADFREFLKVDDGEDNTIMAALTAATNQAELFTRRTIYRGTWRSYMEYFSCTKLDILPVVTSSIVIKYYDVNNALQTLSASEYYVKDHGDNDFAEIIFDGTMPSLYDRYEPIYIEFTAGYDTGYLPDGIKMGILKMAADYYENRTNEVSGSINQSLYGSQQLWYPYKMMG